MKILPFTLRNYHNPNVPMTANLIHLTSFIQMVTIPTSGTNLYGSQQSTGARNLPFDKPKYLLLPIQVELTFGVQINVISGVIITLCEQILPFLAIGILISPMLLYNSWTIGISLPLTLYATMSPSSTTCLRLLRTSKSSRWKTGSMLPERTTTMGEGESVKLASPSHRA